MKTIRFTEFRNNASLYLTEVENGESIRVIRHGRAIAEITPPSTDSGKTPAWKKKGLKLSAMGKSLSSAILEERDMK
jgi:antitoxin (DNA-binding transcriptional repressor) of toxin-antitoxin stability system